MTGPGWFIVTPPYTHASAGVVVLHRLCHKLRQLGVRAVVSTPGVNPEWMTPWAEQPEPGAVVVYPESIGGNSFNAQHVVRWVLYYPGMIGSRATTYDPRELVAYYGEQYRVGAGPVVYMSPVDADRFFNTHAEKLMDVVWVYKGDRTAAPWPAGAAEITLKWPPNRAATAALLRGARRVFSYDLNTALLHEAALCGAEVLVPRDGAWVQHVPEPEPFGWDDLTEVQRLVTITRAWFRLG
jgi:hypothetical protein